MMKTLASWNVNGIRAAVKKGMLDWLQAYQPDILCVQETKAAPEQLDETIVHQNGYHSYWQPAQRKGYSGTMCYTKEEPIAIEPLGNDIFDEEGRVQILQYPDFYLLNCYFPNSQDGGKRLDYKLAFCDAILKKCNALVNDGHHTILCGDVNIAHTEIDLKNPKTNQKNAGFLPEERSWMTTFLSQGYADTFRLFTSEGGHYSWWSYRFNCRAKDIGWRIDGHYVNTAFVPRVKASRILKDVLGSDHCPVVLEIS